MFNRKESKGKQVFEGEASVLPIPIKYKASLQSLLAASWPTFAFMICLLLLKLLIWSSKVILWIWKL